MDDFHVIFAYDAKDAFTKLEAGTIHLAVVDMQVGTGGMWSAEETQNFKLTGIKLCDEIRSKYPDTKVAILTGTHHTIPNMEKSHVVFFLRKPVDPAELTRAVQNALS